MELLPPGFENSFTWGGLFWGFLFGVVGWYLLKAGRKKADFPVIFTGLALMIYPYFFTSAWATFGVGIALCGVGYFFWQKSA